MDNRFSSRRYWFNDLNSSSYQQQGRFDEGAEKKGEKNNVYRINLLPTPFPRSFASEPARKTSGALHGDRRAHIYVYPRNCIAEHGEIRGRGRPGLPPFPLPCRASPAKRMHFGCSCEFVRASNARVHELFMRRDVGGVRRPGVEPGTARTTRYSIYFAGSAHTRIRERWICIP